MLMSPIPGILHFLWSLTPTSRRHWAIKRRPMSKLLELCERRQERGQGSCALDRALPVWKGVPGLCLPANNRRHVRRAFSALGIGESIPVGSGRLHQRSSATRPDLTCTRQGHEAIASLLSWAVKLVTNAPAEQKLCDALRVHFPSSPQTPPVEVILAANIPYFDASIK